MISNTKSDDNLVRYFVVQHTPDLFRRETRNVGVVVLRDDGCRGRFFGERNDGELDGRTIRCFEHPEVYREWVKYWRRVLREDIETLGHNLTRPNGSQFNVIDAGFIKGSNGDALDDVCHFAYSMLVSDGGLIEALGGSVEELQAFDNLRNDIAAEFHRLEIMGGSQALLLPHPVMANKHFVGATDQSHTVSFAQQNGGWTVMEPINFSTIQKHLAKDRAGCTAHIFKDLVERYKERMHPVAIVRYSDSDRQLEIVNYSLELLVKARCQVVLWEDPNQRGMFLRERVEASGKISIQG